MKLNITPGPWIFSKGKHNGAKPDPNSIGSIQGTTETLWCIAEIQCDCAENGLDGQEESEANAAAIVTAVNNTYHKGINPEAVPEMLEFLAAIARHPKNDTLADFLIDDAKKLIQKATL